MVWAQFPMCGVGCVVEPTGRAERERERVCLFSLCLPLPHGTPPSPSQALSPSLGLPYAGKQPAPSSPVVFWRVALVDATGAPCGFSDQVGSFGVGAPLAPSEWGSAQWISPPVTLGPLPCDFYDPVPTPLFRKSFVVDGQGLVAAELHITGLG